MESAEIGEFLSARRARIQPGDVGLISYGQRRVPGLRREELARLAGVSVDYYVKLEQGRRPGVSDAILDALCTALRLDDAERAHLYNLARPSGTRSAHPARPVEHIRPGLRRLVESMPDTPSFVVGRSMDFLTWNVLADALIGMSSMPAATRNGAHHIFLDPAARDLYPDWEEVAEETVGYLRLTAGRHPDDPVVANMTGQLAVKSDDFRRLWAQQSVRDKTSGTKLIRHHVVGLLEFQYETLISPGDDQILVAYTSPAGSTTDERMRLLSSWTGSPIRTSRSCRRTRSGLLSPAGQVAASAVTVVPSWMRCVRGRRGG